MKELLQQYAAYNLWANKLLVDTINKLSDEEKIKEVTSSFPSLYKTVQHMWLAEEVWWQRLKLVENIVLQSETFDGSFDELVTNHTKKSKEYLDWILGATENQLLHVFAYLRKKEQFKMPVYQMLQHVFNHATYHRGQLVTILRQLGVETIPSTDFSTFCMKK